MFYKRASNFYKRLIAPSGYCPICEGEVKFFKKGKSLRDHYRCSQCNSIPRFRAIIDSIKRFYPDYANLAIHESSPSTGASSKFLSKRCKNYSASQYFANVPRGETKDGFQSEDLTQLTFSDNSFDLLITQDVFEHVLQPDKAFKEIARVLKPGGAHIFSMPWYPQYKTTIQRAKLENGILVHVKEPVYHGNPADRDKGSLVTFDWGQDFVDFIYKSSGMTTTIYLQRDVKKGLDGDFLEIFISKKM
jgi:SAM-dependent methyltransferase